ncbi:OmpA family protein [Chitinivibrio alkaliphilus]|uniref:Peptidoglycan-associated lipoprotein of the Tol-Pal system n=1 Tax=Chitinivibrio alkaliphilus ACht1 TaxID=1313304 RepID=U7D824_9BACT|nr:OmpA family protein [Chitinivibrio alkaliphilus]ERP39105.1 peptidoglycan-associated lipoprotein of the Tol-Pal system [Chitinivibrio alkaliphilus ACht1]
MKAKGFLLSVLVFFLLFLGGCGRDTGVVDDIDMDPVEESVVPEEEPLDTADWDEVDTTTLEPVDMDSLAAEYLQTIYFDFDDYSLNNTGREKAIAAAEFLLDHDTIRIRLDGHCDERGSSEYNMALGERRAEAVYAIFMSYGVPENRVEVTSFGKESPAEFGCTDSECHQLNRRVEMTQIRR